MWPSGDCIDRFPAIGVTLLAHLRMTTRGNSVVRLTVASLIHWLSFPSTSPTSPLLCLLCLLDPSHLLRLSSCACLHTSITCLPSWHTFVLNKRHVAAFYDTAHQMRPWCFRIASTCMNHSAHLLLSLLSVLLGFLFIHLNERSKRLGDTCFPVDSDGRLARLVMFA